MSHSTYQPASKMPKINPKPLKVWDGGGAVPVEPEAHEQLSNVASMPFIHHHVAAMPDMHWGLGATVGSVIPTKGAIIPAAVGVDIGCGMMAVRLDGVTSDDLADSNLGAIRAGIEHTVPVGFATHRASMVRPYHTGNTAALLAFIDHHHPKLGSRRKESLDQIIHKQHGTLGGGNHFIELCIAENGELWLMLHSGSRGIGNVIGQYFIELAKKDMRQHLINLPDQNLAYLSDGTKNFDDYVFALRWAQEYAAANRREMMRRVLIVLRGLLPPFKDRTEVVNCHHNYVEMEHHFGADVLVTRKGAVRARKGDMGIIPGSMGAKSYIVRGLGNPDSFHSCSHGAGRVMSRKRARAEISLEQHAEATAGVECRKDEGVLDESPAAYKDIDAVMAAQTDLVEVVHTLKQVLCIKG